MRRRHVALVFSRELLDYRRQRKVWRRLFLQPFAVILLLAVPVLVFRSADEKERRQRFSIAVQGDVAAVPGLLEALDRRPLEAEVVDDGERAVVSRGKDAALVVAGDAAADVAAGRPVGLLVLTLPVESSSRFAGEALVGRLAEVRTSTSTAALERAGLTGAVASPFALRTVDLSTASSEGTRFGLAQALPPLLVIQLFGLMASAEERIAGAKDRRVLEPLLLLPFRRIDILLGIGAATMSAGMLAASVLFVPLVVGLSVALAAVSGEVAGPLEVGAALFLGITLFGSVFTAVGLYAGARAHSGGEGSVFVTVAQLTVFALVSMTPFLTDVAARGPVLLVPVLGAMLLVRDVVAGGFELGPTLLALSASGAVAVTLLRRAVHLLDAEGAILRSAG
ncbi:MAG TPA: ABC transporter permease [Acidimicrobiales bacterium]|nr:ABC transporter permease [Acidimicrobiales bacterium]